ncbi:MAG: protein jag [Anaerolineae bacterium CG_4_9_14_3_um_filter_57_17]|nr:protein jag [bacterium]NCT21225.1 protein jag [bacterium]OIO84253.1 MAG: hypothetical protein AUK01_10145 [Anaerolineae bacterium CG2_30_57_67]PJB68601.1 MAG: protein jag [Anaerolineae bacterium CG_4_9_14_3_um_filter_57_17]
MERTNLEVIAPTIEEATARGLEQLGVSSEMVEVEVLDEGTRGFLGMGSRQARIRMTLKSADALAAPASAHPSDAASPTPAAADDDLLNFTAETARELLARMKLTATVTVSYGAADLSGEKNILVDIRGDDLSVLIGRRAETMNALQYILGLIVSKQTEAWVQVTVDVEGYRARREQQLRQLARRMAEQAICTGKRQVLEPMSSAERRIIHLELREVPEVISESVGEDPNRKVTISPKI